MIEIVVFRAHKDGVSGWSAEFSCGLQILATIGQGLRPSFGATPSEAATALLDQLKEDEL